MATTKTYNFMEMDKILRKNGYKYISCRGDHYKYRRDNETIVMCKRKPNKMILQRLIKENKLTV